MNCDHCGERPATQARSVDVNGEKKGLYICDECEAESKRATVGLERPCESCRQAEGEVKLTRFIKGRRVVSFLCQACAVG